MSLWFQWLLSSVFLLSGRQLCWWPLWQEPDPSLSAMLSFKCSLTSLSSIKSSSTCFPQLLAVKQPPPSPLRKNASPSMQYLNNRAESHLSNPAECELETLGKGGVGWVNQAYSGSTVSLPRAVSTVYTPQSLFHSSMDSMCSLGIPGSNPYPAAEAKVQHQPTKSKKNSGCCSCLWRGIKGRGQWLHSFCV